jgi:hypothetical protein
MDFATFRMPCAVAVAALMLAGGSAAAVAQDAGKATPEWQQYDKLDDRYGPLAWLTVEQVMGAPVVDEQGEPVGEIVHLLREKSGGMFYVVVDAPETAGQEDHVVPVDHFEVVGDDQASRKIVMTGEGTGDFDASDFEPAPPPSAEQQQG